MKKPQLEEMFQDIYDHELEKWLVIAKKNPKLAAMKLALYLFEENLKTLNNDELIEKWRRIRNGQE